MSYIILGFEVSQNYDEREIEDLLELVETRGAIYQHWNGPTYRLHIPDSMDWNPFFETIKSCPSIQYIHPVPMLSDKRPVEPALEE